MARVKAFDVGGVRMILQWGRMKGSDRKAIIRGVEEHRVELLQEFDACQGIEEAESDG